ncbi:hypothetical protein ABK040_004530 [Willaertia magna]
MINNSIVIDIPPNSYLERKNKEENKSAISKVSKTSKNSKTSKTSKVSTNKNNFLRIDTCCGTIELSSVKIVSLIGIFLTTIAFLTLSGVILATRILQRGQNGIDIALDRGEIRTMRERLTAATFLALYSDTPLEYITLHNETSVTYLKTIEKLVVEFPVGFSNGWLNKYSSNNTSIIGIERAALTLISEGKRNEALSLINTTNYFNLFNSFNNDLNEVLDLALSKERGKEEDLLAITVVGLIVIAIGLIILFPLMIGIFIFAINRDQLNLKKIKQANSVLLMDTMNNDKLRELFKKHCEKELSVENFKFLEKVTIYKRFCEQSFTIQEKLYGSDHSTSSDTTTSNNNNNNHNNQDNTNNSNNNNNKKQQVTEQDLRKIENKKYETAFDIYTDFLDINGGNAVNISKLFIEEVKKQLDNFNTGHNEILPEVLFDNAAREISIVMLDTHQRFKASLAFQKEMKIHKLQTKKVKL